MQHNRIINTIHKNVIKQENKDLSDLDVDLIRKRFNLKVKKYSRTQTGKAESSSISISPKEDKVIKLIVAIEKRREMANGREKERRSNEMEKFHTAPRLTRNGR